MDIDLQHDFPKHIMVERQDFALIGVIEYEKISDFGYHCQIIGHSTKF